MKQLFIYLIAALALAACTSNQRAKNYGGTQEIKLDAGQRLINVTWKDDDLWLLTKTDSTKPPAIYYFDEKSSFGVMNGHVIITEQ